MTDGDATRLEELQAELKAARRTIDALVRRQLQQTMTDLGRDRIAIVRALGTLESVVARRTEALRTSEQRYRALYDRAPDPLATVDGERRLVQWNDMFARVLHLRREQLAGRLVDELLTPASTERLKAAHAAGHDSDDEIPIELVRSDGAILSTLMKAVRLPAETADGGEQCHLAFHDVTEKLRMERELALTQRLAAVGALAAGVAHEVNNPLTVVRGQAELLLLDDGLAGRARTKIQAIRDYAMRIADIVSNLHAFAGGEAGMAADARVDEAARQAVDGASSRRPGAPVTLRVTGNPADLTVRADLPRLVQALRNIVENACEASQGGQTVDVSVHGGARSVVVEVRDRGAGIPREHLERLFSPFFTTREVGQGRGLGLAVAYGIVRELGGQVRAENRRGGGALFRVTLPRTDEDEEEATPGTGAAWPVAGRTAVVVDDEPLIRDLVETILRDAGFAVVAFPSGDAALAGLEGQQPDVVLTDVRMPGMDGIALRDALIGREPRMGGRVVLMTGLIELTQRRDIPSLQKPFSRDELLAVVSDVIDAADGAEERA